MAGKAGLSVLKLKKLWDEVRNVPQTIADLMMQIECLDPAIWDAETHFAENELCPLLWDPTAARKSTQCCRIALQKLSDLVGDLSMHIDSARRVKRKLSCLKVVLKKDELRTLEKRLETAVRMLQSAQNGYMITLLKLQPDIIVAKAVAQLTPSQNPMSVTILPHSDEPEVTQKDYSTIGTFGTQRRSALLRNKSSTSKSWIVRLQAPAWLLDARKAWEICAQRSFGGWNINLRIYTMRPGSTLVFKAALEGDVGTLQKMFDIGEASPFDTDEHGFTLAHYSVAFTAMDTLQLLADMGISLNEPSHNGMPVLSLIGYTHRVKLLDHEKYPQFMSILDHGGYLQKKDLTSSSDDCECPLTGHWDLFQKLQPLCCPNHRQTSTGSRITRLWNLRVPDVRVIKSIIGPRWAKEAGLICNLFDQSGNSENPLIHIMARLIGDHIFCRMHSAVTSRLGGCSEFAAEVIRNTSNIHVRRVIHIRLNVFQDSYVPIGWSSPLVRLVFQLLFWNRPIRRPRVERLTRSGLLQWLGIVKDAGVDLSPYGRKENEILLNDGIARNMCCWHTSEHTLRGSSTYYPGWETVNYQLRWYLYGFRTGSEPEDWEILWNEPTDDFLEDFWALVEDRSLDIPGSWVE
ncbi:uncharacterized protein PG986_010209 [Apiospora aurea]|uniref:Uncharacterized protein n=1 Tax=Apiospora aurea TaxID=335848 RepID=A0ABR1Q9V9_9PEZI